MVVATSVDCCAAAVTMCAASLRGNRQGQQGYEHAVGWQGGPASLGMALSPDCERSMARAEGGRAGATQSRENG